MFARALSLYAVPVHVKPLDGAEMPKELLGAYLACYVTTTDQLRALKLAVEGEDHYKFLEMNGGIVELDPTQWDAYVRATWPSDVDFLPKQSELQEQLSQEEAFYGPFCSYDNEIDT
jgi:hypothetical protein